MRLRLVCFHESLINRQDITGGNQTHNVETRLNKVIKLDRVENFEMKDNVAY